MWNVLKSIKARREIHTTGPKDKSDKTSTYVWRGEKSGSEVKLMSEKKMLQIKEAGEPK